jgi:hypothetical protein
LQSLAQFLTLLRSLRRSDPREARDGRPSYDIGAGDNDYVACVIAPTTDADARARSQSPFLRVLRQSEPLPAAGVQVNVPAGAPQLVASLSDAEGNVPQGVNVTLTRPDGTVLNQQTTPYAEGEVVETRDGYLTACVVGNPQPGNWTIQAESTNDDDEYQFFFSTGPTANVVATVDATLSSMSDPDALAALEDELGESWGCFWCKLGAWAVAGVLLALIAAGVAYITAAAAPIAALAAFLSVSTAAATSLVVGIASLVGLGVGGVANYVCYWAHACPQPKGVAA